MPMPKSARNRNRNQNVGEKPAMKLQAEYHAIEIISGVLRPTRSASQPEAVAPNNRIHNVKVKTAVTAVNGTLNSCEIGNMISRKIVKSKASRVQPSHAATQASHWSLVGSFHQGTLFTVSPVAMPSLPLGPAHVPGRCGDFIPPVQDCLTLFYYLLITRRPSSRTPTVSK